METISKIIYNALVTKTGIYLPKIGSLTVVNVPARELGAGKFTAPYMRVEFATKKNDATPNIVDLLTQGGAKDAKAQYQEWLTKATQEKGKVKIEGVGEIRSKFFYSSSALAKVLGKPETVKASKAKKEKKPCNKKTLRILAGILLLVALIALLFICAQEGTPEPAPAPVVEAPAPVVTPEPEPEPEPVVIETPKNYHVIIGSFTKAANAERLAAKNENYQVITLAPNRILVSAYAAETRAEAVPVREKYRTEDDDVWIYTIK